MVDANGLEINKNRLIALLSSIVLADYPGSTIVTDSVTNAGLAQFIAARGGKHLRYKRGYANVISKVLPRSRSLACLPTSTVDFVQV